MKIIYFGLIFLFTFNFIINVNSFQWIKNAMYQQGNGCEGEIMSASYQVSGSCANEASRMYCNDEGTNITISYYSKMYCKGNISETDQVPVNNCTYGQEVFTCVKKPVVPEKNTFTIYRTNNYCGNDWEKHLVSVDYTMMNSCIYDSQSSAFSYECNENNVVIKKIYNSTNSCEGGFEKYLLTFDNCSVANSYPYYTICK